MGKLVEGAGNILGGNSARKSKTEEARLLRARAMARRAESHQGARDERRQAELVQSRALAVAAASGGGVSDPTVVNLMGDIEAEGEYRALNRLYEGETEARGLADAGTIAYREGKAAQFGSLFRAAGNLYEGGQSLYEKYGPSGA